ncbi:uncharacterized protein LOC105665380 [Ceratitis capitata]|uniref:uncharacterized protein LOC105665380 n=1 Tax=Ceratitis capitata TaxID=7213 RepID=UPI00061891B2|nr:uncharacterized protein LOC105665380 [Ceratitis capitata]
MLLTLWRRVYVLATALLLCSYLTPSYAWKPIVGGAFTTTFNLQQSHPGSATSAKSLTLGGSSSSSSGSSGGSSAESAEYSTSPLLPQEAASKVLSGVGDAVAIAAPLTSHAGLKFESDEFEYERDLFGGGDYREDHCAVKKFAFNHDGIVTYENDLPALNQFTICFWSRYTNHSGDHVLLTYAVKDEPREFQFWVSNSKNSSFTSMAIKGQQIYRLNYPLRVRQWHHHCTSWNGKTGEWQVWVKSERIGRGFNNALVGHTVPAKGKLYSGGPSSTGALSQGLHFEITLVQIYHIALSAGKAHRDHKHHHAHHFDFEGKELVTTTRAPPAINRPLPMHSLLASGQIPSRVRINLAQPPQQKLLAQPQQVIPAAQPQLQAALGADNTIFPLSDQQQAVTINTNFVNGQINAGSRLVTQQLLGHIGQPPSGVVSSSLQQPKTVQTSSTTREYSTLNNPANVQFIDETETRIIFKRQAESNNTSASFGGEKVLRKRAVNAVRTRPAQKNLQKRGLVLLEDGSVVDDPLFGSSFKYDGLAEFGGQQFKHDLTLKMNIEEEVHEHDREPAEEEVKAVMALCSACDTEPFQGAIVFAWKDVKEDMDNTLKGLSVGGCGNF